jgi:hypothetical protein
MFYAKPKLNNHHDAQTFENVASAVAFLNEYNEMGSDKDPENKVAKLQAEDWWLLGKLVGPEGTEFKNNKVVEAK